MLYGFSAIFMSEEEIETATRNPFSRIFNLLELMSEGRVGGDTGLCNRGRCSILPEKVGIH